jgi:hypothetical protein
MRAIKQYFNFPFAMYSGVVMDEATMKKVAKLLYKQNQELKELLMNNIDSLELANWTLAYPNGKQECINYICEENYQTTEQRIALLDKTARIERVTHMYIGTSKEAIAEHMKLYDDGTEVDVKEQPNE